MLEESAIRSRPPVAGRPPGPPRTALAMALGVVAILAAALVGTDAPAQAGGPRFEIAFPDDVSAEPLTGRMFLVLARDAEREPRLQVGRYGVQFFGVDFEALAPGEAVVVDAATLGYPAASLSDVEPGRYHVQAVLNRYTRFDRADGHTVWMHMDRWEGQDWRRSPGNAVSRVMRLDLDPAGGDTVRLETDHVLPPVEVPDDTRSVKRFRIRSELLSEFWGRDIWIGATVLLPKGYDDDPDAHYPTVYRHGHFSLRAPFGYGEERGQDLTQAWDSDDLPRFVAVTMQHPTPYFDDSYAVNSANNGPYGDAIHEELIPEIESRFRVIREPWARVLTGGSTGGWIAFALQVFYPDSYGGTWSFAPDPLDFRNVEGIDIYADANAFYKQKDWYRVPTPNTRDPETETIRLTSKQRNTMELVNGTRGRSGEQLDIWSAVHGPVGDDGYTRPLFDKATGEIDPEVAEYWRDNYDLRHYLEENWKEVGPDLVGKLHVFCGRMDHFYLNVGVYHMEAFLETTRDPYYAGSFSYGARGGHGWRPFDNAELLRRMARHIAANAPAGTDTGAWMKGAR